MKRRVALAVPQGLPFLERLLHGITDFARRNGGWTLTRLPEALGTSVEWLRHWTGDGAFVLVVSSAEARAARRLRFPVVNLASHLPSPGLPTVVVDHRRIGAMAAAHLLERRFRRFGYYGAAGLWYSEQRRDGFRQAIAEAGGGCEVLEAQTGPTAGGGRDQTRQLEAWLHSLVPPVGIMASTDLRAGMVLEACRALGLRVPEDVAVIGVDNDPVFGEFDDPPLTSISRNDHEVGRQAAAMLEALMATGGRAARRTAPRLVLVPPDGIIQRGSIATVAIDDPIVGRIARHIREHVHEPSSVAQLLRHAPLSRRAFEYRFRAALGSSPHAYINRVRIDAARRLLAGDPPMKIAAVAAACGFRSPRRFRIVFLQLTGQTPAAYRRAARPAPPR